MAGDCCDLHGPRCEPPSELCCAGCTEVAHPLHRDGSPCVLTVWPPADPQATPAERAYIRRRYGLTASQVDEYVARGERPHPDAPAIHCGVADPRASFPWERGWWCALGRGHAGDHDRRVIRPTPPPLAAEVMQVLRRESPPPRRPGVQELLDQLAAWLRAQDVDQHREAP